MEDIESFKSYHGFLCPGGNFKPWIYWTGHQFWPDQISESDGDTGMSNRLMSMTAISPAQNQFSHGDSPLIVDQHFPQRAPVQKSDANPTEIPCQKWRSFRISEVLSNYYDISPEKLFPVVFNNLAPLRKGIKCV